MKSGSLGDDLIGFDLGSNLYGFGEEVREFVGESRKLGGSTNEDDFLNLKRVEVCLLESFFNLGDDAGVDGSCYEVESHAVDGSVEVHTFCERFDRAGSRVGSGEGFLGNFDGETEFHLSPVVRGLDRDTSLLGELLSEEVHELLVELVSS